MSASVSVNLVTNPELEKLLQSRSDIRAGDKLEGKVLERRDNGRVLMDFGKFKAEVDLKIPVEQGDVVRMVVVEKAKQIKLKIESVQHGNRAPRDAAQLLKEANVHQEKSLEELHTRIDKLLEKETATRERTGDKPAEKVLEDIGKELGKLRENLRGSESRQTLPKEVKEEVRELLKNVETTLKRMPEKQDAQGAQRLENLSKAIRQLRTSLESNRDVQDLRERIVKDVTRLKEQVRDLELPDKKDLEKVIQRLSEAADKIKDLKSPEQRAQLRRAINEEIKPNLKELRQTLDTKAENPQIKEADQQAIKEISRRAENLDAAIDITIKRAPPGETAQDIDVLVKDLRKAAVEVARSEAPRAPEAPVEKEAPVRQDVPVRQDASVRQDVPVRQDAPVRQEAPVRQDVPVERPERVHAEIRREINLEVARLRVELEPVQPRETLPPEVKPRMEQLLERVEITLKELPEAVRSRQPQQLTELFDKVRDLRTTVDAGREFRDLQEQVVKEVARLKNLAENLPPDQRKELEAVIDKLTKAAEKIQQLKGPEQSAELRRIIGREVRPNLETLDQAVSRQIKDLPPEIMENRANLEVQRLMEIKEGTEQLRRDVEQAVARLPETPPKEINTQVKDIEGLLLRMSQTAGEAPQFSESIQEIYENIKVALRMLHRNLRIDGGKLEIPEEIRQVFLNLQSDLNAAEASDKVISQLTELRDMISRADLPMDKVVKEIVNSLDDMIAQIKELKDSGKFQEIRELVQNRLAPQLKMLAEVFADPRLTESLDLRQDQAVLSIRTAFQQLLSGMESAFVRGEALEPSSELGHFTQLTERLASLPRGQSGQAAMDARTSESIANLSKHIEAMLSRLPENAAALDNGAAIPAKIRGLLSTLRSHFEPLDIGQNAMKLAGRLKSMVDDSGVFFEKKLSDVIDRLGDASQRIRDVQSLDQLPEIRNIIDRDMKPNLLQLREFLRGQQAEARFPDKAALETLRNAVDDLLTNIAGQQDRAVESQAQQQAPYQAFSFHLPIKGEDPAELKIFYNKGREKDSPDEIKMSIFLEMSNLGEVRSDFFSVKKDLSISFYVRDEQVRDHFSQHIHEVEEALEPLFGDVNTAIVVSREKLEEFESEELFPQIISDKEVDVKI